MVGRRDLALANSAVVHRMAHSIVWLPRPPVDETARPRTPHTCIRREWTAPTCSLDRHPCLPVRWRIWPFHPEMSSLWNRNTTPARGMSGRVDVDAETRAWSGNNSRMAPRRWSYEPVIVPDGPKAPLSCHFAALRGALCLRVMPGTVMIKGEGETPAGLRHDDYTDEY